MKVAMFKRLGEWSYDTVAGDELEGCGDFVRITEYVDVEFPPLESARVVEKQLEALDKAEQEVRSKFEGALCQIERQRQELRAITYVPATRTDGSVDEYLQ